MRISPEGRRSVGVVALLGHELHAGAGRARELAAAAGLQLDVVHHGADRHVAQRQRVAHRDLGATPDCTVMPTERRLGARM
jgi:hypothetical protein